MVYCWSTIVAYTIFLPSSYRTIFNSHHHNHLTVRRQRPVLPIIVDGVSWYQSFDQIIIIQPYRTTVVLSHYCHKDEEYDETALIRVRRNHICSMEYVCILMLFMGWYCCIVIYYEQCCHRYHQNNHHPRTNLNSNEIHTIYQSKGTIPKNQHIHDKTTSREGMRRW